jgi:predicted phage tail protein
MFDRVFLSHPRSVGETYVEHAGVAGRFGATMIVGGVACLIHAVLPAVFPRAASDRVKRLYAQMVARQPNAPAMRQAHREPEWQIEYEI